MRIGLVVMTIFVFFINLVNVYGQSGNENTWKPSLDSAIDYVAKKYKGSGNRIYEGGSPRAKSSMFIFYEELCGIKFTPLIDTVLGTAIHFSKKRKLTISVCVTSSTMKAEMLKMKLDSIYEKSRDGKDTLCQNLIGFHFFYKNWTQYKNVVLFLGDEGISYDEVRKMKRDICNRLHISY